MTGRYICPHTTIRLCLASCCCLRSSLLDLCPFTIRSPNWLRLLLFFLLWLYCRNSVQEGLTNHELVCVVICSSCVHWAGNQNKTRMEKTHDWCRPASDAQFERKLTRGSRRFTLDQAMRNWTGSAFQDTTLTPLKMMWLVELSMSWSRLRANHIENRRQRSPIQLDSNTLPRSTIWVRRKY